MTVDEVTQRRLQRLVEELIVQLKARHSVTYGTDYVGDVETWRRGDVAKGCPNRRESPWYVGSDGRVPGRDQGLGLRGSLTRPAGVLARPLSRLLVCPWPVFSPVPGFGHQKSPPLTVIFNSR